MSIANSNERYVDAPPLIGYSPPEFRREGFLRSSGPRRFMSITLHQLHVLPMVAKLGSFTDVGKTLRIGQPSVTALVNSLSRELGVKLFEKFGVKSRLTTFGEEWF